MEAVIIPQIIMAQADFTAMLKEAAKLGAIEAS
jgi:hypothetical protein